MVKCNIIMGQTDIIFFLECGLQVCSTGSGRPSTCIHQTENHENEPKQCFFEVERRGNIKLYTRMYIWIELSDFIVFRIEDVSFIIEISLSRFKYEIILLYGDFIDLMYFSEIFPTFIFSHFLNTAFVYCLFNTK